MKVQQGCNSTDMGIPVTTEEELRRNTVITPEDVLGLQKITKSKWSGGGVGADYCKPSAVRRLHTGATCCMHWSYWGEEKRQAQAPWTATQTASSR